VSDHPLPSHVIDAIRATDSMTELLTVVAGAARALIPAHQAAVTLVAGRKWTMAAHAFSLSDKYAAWRTYDENPDGSGVYRLVSELDRPMRLTQAELEAHAAWRGFSAAAAWNPPMRGWLAAPLHGSRGQGIGVIQLTDKHEGEFTEDDEAKLVALARCVSGVLGPLRAASRRRRAERLR
jgi:transcriptional regulator with GAF, ATPase, and Fis domain